MRLSVWFTAVVCIALSSAANVTGQKPIVTNAIGRKPTATNVTGQKLTVTAEIDSWIADTLHERGRWRATLWTSNEAIEYAVRKFDSQSLSPLQRGNLADQLLIIADSTAQVRNAFQHALRSSDGSKRIIAANAIAKYVAKIAQRSLLENTEIPAWTVDALLFSLMNDDVELQKVAQATVGDWLQIRQMRLYSAPQSGIDSVLRQKRMISAQSRLLFSDDMDVVRVAAQALLIAEVTNPRIQQRMRELLRATHSDITMAAA